MKRLAQVQVETLQFVGNATERHDQAIEQHDRAIERHDRAVEQHDREMSELRQAQIATAQSLARLSDAQLTTQAGLDALIATVDRFIRGGANGHQ